MILALETRWTLTWIWTSNRRTPYTLHLVTQRLAWFAGTPALPLSMTTLRLYNQRINLHVLPLQEHGSTTRRWAPICGDNFYSAGHQIPAQRFTPAITMTSIETVTIHLLDNLSRVFAATGEHSFWKCRGYSATRSKFEKLNDSCSSAAEAWHGILPKVTIPRLSFNENFNFDNPWFFLTSKNSKLQFAELKVKYATQWC